MDRKGRRDRQEGEERQTGRGGETDGKGRGHRQKEEGETDRKGRGRVNKYTWSTHTV